LLLCDRARRAARGGARGTAAAKRASRIGGHGDPCCPEQRLPGQYRSGESQRSACAERYCKRGGARQKHDDDGLCATDVEHAGRSQDSSAGHQSTRDHNTGQLQGIIVDGGHIDARCRQGRILAKWQASHKIRNEQRHLV
jgi:hypothetical protein